MPVNVELKARDPDREASIARCVALGAADHGLLHQRDTYFAARTGRLKLREQRELGSELIAYRRTDALESEHSTYTRAPVTDAESLRGALGTALGTTVVVVKRRRLFIWENVRIHLDEVDGLGSFIELEALVDGDVAAAEAKAAKLRTELAIEDASLVAVGYSDLLMDSRDVLLQAAHDVMRSAYAPYSGFKVGAAVRGPSGAIHVGANIENAAYPQGQCAEASALGALVAAGEFAITAVAVVAERAEYCPPCGGCRQRLAEFGNAHTPVHLGRPGGEPNTVPLGELLPMAFTSEALPA